jgi:hypothetical protein
MCAGESESVQHEGEGEGEGEGWRRTCLRSQRRKIRRFYTFAALFVSSLTNKYFLK